MAAVRHLGNWRLNSVACNADQRKLSVFFFFFFGGGGKGIHI